jgi:hypothetical protein
LHVPHDAECVFIIVIGSGLGSFHRGVHVIVSYSESTADKVCFMSGNDEGEKGCNIAEELEQLEPP